MTHEQMVDKLMSAGYRADVSDDGLISVYLPVEKMSDRNTKKIQKTISAFGWKKSFRIKYLSE